MKEIRVAKSAGFCFGVSRSVDMAQKLLEEQGSARSLGPIIHNEDVVNALAERGLHVAKSVEEIQPGEAVMIRAHGVAPAVYEALRARGAVITDATCPKVRMIHRIVREASEQGRFVIIIGMRNHPEVEAIRGWCGEHVVLENPAETAEWIEKNPDFSDKMITIVVQTTQTSGNFTECCEIVKKRCTNLRISDTICLATSTRQEEAKTLSSECDAMVVIGGRHSANSLHLAEICSSVCSHVQFIERSDELKEVRNKMSDEIKVEESTVEKEQSFDEMLEETLKTIYNGDKVSGVVVAITGTEVSIDLGTKYSGFIPTTEFTEDGSKLEDVVKVGDQIEAIVVRVNDVEGTAQLSKKRLDAVKIWDNIEQAVESGEVIEGVVTETNKGGVVVNYKGVRVFVPASQTDLPRESDLTELVKKTVRLKLTEVNKARKRVVGSIRRVAQAERRAATEAIWNEIEVGKKYHGTVKSLTSYGAFVDIGGIDGMVHVSELSWNRIHQPSEVVSVGDEIDVYVISFDKEKHKISLGYKDPEANPWSVFTNRYSVGDVANVTIVKLMDFGAFATVVPGVDGLIHISQIANRRIEKPGDVLTVGDVVEAKITAIDEEKHKVSLSIRALSAPAPAAPVAEAEEEEDEDDGSDAMVYSLSADGQAIGEAPTEVEE